MQTDTHEPAIERASRLAETQRFENHVDPASIAQILGQMKALVDRVMGEAGLYAPEHAAIAIKQAQGDSVEASMILRSFRQSLTRRYQTEMLDTENMRLERRISSAFREIPGGQILGPTRDYTQRLIEEDIAWETQASTEAKREELEKSLKTDMDAEQLDQTYPRISDVLKEQDLVRSVDEHENRAVFDATRNPIAYPAPRSAALQTLARSETGGMMALGYSAMRGQGGDHPTIGELRVGLACLKVTDKRGRTRHLGRIRVTESANISKIKVRKKDPVPYMSLGYGLCFGQNETKAICMGILDRSMRVPGDGAPAVSQEFVLHHLEGPDSYGFIQSLTMPEYVGMASELHDLRAAIERERRSREAKTARVKSEPISSVDPA